MLRHTFQHLPGIRERGERRLWLAGALRWADLTEFLPSRTDPGRFRTALAESEAAWTRGDAAWFGKRLPSRESWRIHRDYHEDAGYLDIETTGPSQSADSTTCVAVAYRGAVRTFVKGRDLDELPHFLHRCKLLVTFNGQTFDLPFLRREFGEEAFEGLAHFDVCIALRRLGRRGGLKRLERELGVPRDGAFDGIDGSHAVDLWARHLTGDRRALSTLERYCAEDVLGLPALAHLASNALLAETPFAECLTPLKVPARIPCDLPYSSDLAEELREARRPRDAWSAP